MYLKIIINALLILALGTIELSFLSGLPLGADNLNLALVVFIFILITGGLNLALWWAFGFGLLVDLFSFLPFGTYMASLMLGVLALEMILNFFTNRSLYALLATSFFGTIAYELIFNLTSYVTTTVSGRDFPQIFNDMFWRSEAYKIGFNIIGVFLVFYALNSLSNRLKPVFLIKKHQ